LIARLPEEAIDPGEFTLRQRRISAIQSSVDVNFGPIVAIDRFQKAPVDVTREGLDIAPDDNLIETLEDIRL
jgi:hypothetical protein